MQLENMLKIVVKGKLTMALSWIRLVPKLSSHDSGHGDARDFINRRSVFRML